MRWGKRRQGGGEAPCARSRGAAATAPVWERRKRQHERAAARAQACCRRTRVGGIAAIVCCACCARAVRADWLNNWEQQWGAECSSMMFELPHFAVELLVILPCVQVRWGGGVGGGRFGGVRVGGSGAPRERRALWRGAAEV